MIAPANLTREEGRAIGLAALTAAATALASGLVAWGLDEARRALRDRRDAREHESEDS